MMAAEPAVAGVLGECTWIPPHPRSGRSGNRFSEGRRPLVPPFRLCFFAPPVPCGVSRCHAIQGGKVRSGR